MLLPEESAIRAVETRIELAVIYERHGRLPRPSLMDITCEECGDNDTCPFAFDLYNTDGDCLALK